MASSEVAPLLPETDIQLDEDAFTGELDHPPSDEPAERVAGENNEEVARGGSDQAEASPEETDQTSADFIAWNKNDIWCCRGPLCRGCTTTDRIQFLIYLLQVFLIAVFITLLSVSKVKGYNQFLPYVTLDPTETFGGHTNTPSVWCMLALYQAVAAVGIIYFIIAARWIAQPDKTHQWLLAEVVLSSLCILLSLLALFLMITSFFIWCTQLVNPGKCSLESNCPKGWQNVTNCFDGVAFIQQNYEYKVEEVYYFFVAAMGVNGVSSLIWVISLIVLLMKFCPLWIQVRRHGYSPLGPRDDSEGGEDRMEYIGPPPGDNADQQMQYHDNPEIQAQANDDDMLSAGDDGDEDHPVTGDLDLLEA